MSSPSTPRTCARVRGLSLLGRSGWGRSRSEASVAGREKAADDARRALLASEQEIEETRLCARTTIQPLAAHSLTARAAVDRELSELYAQIQRVALELAQQGEATHATPHLEAIEDQLRTQALRSRLAAREKDVAAREQRLAEASAARRSDS